MRAALPPTVASLATTDEQRQLFNNMQEIMAAHDGGRDADPAKAIETSGWEFAWQRGITPWANFRVKPPLAYLVENKSLGIPITGRALVPGCGHGDDVVLLGRLGFDAIGIDSSPTAVESASQRINSLTDKPDRARVLQENFFTWTPPEGGFDIIYDYTFFCAIPPTLRPGWGESMTRLVAPGGYLATLVFPIDGERVDGPPYSVSVDAYREVLKEDDWVKVLDEVPPELTAPQQGRARIVVWKSTKV